jgi:hypothetical protein
MAEPPQAAKLPESICGRRWVDVTDEVEAEEARCVEFAARCSPPGLRDFLATTRHVRQLRSPASRTRSDRAHAGARPEAAFIGSKIGIPAGFLFFV